MHELDKTGLEAARDIAEQLLTQLVATPISHEHAAAKNGKVVIAAQQGVRRIIAALAASTSAGVTEEQDLDSRMKAAGMIPLSDLLAGNTPLEKWMAHTSVCDLDTFEEWLMRRYREYMQMRMGYELGDENKSDELYEWVFAHAGAFGDVVANFRQMKARSEASRAPVSQKEAVPVGYTSQGNLDGLLKSPREAWSVWGEKNGLINVPLYASPGPAEAGVPAVKALKWKKSGGSLMSSGYGIISYEITAFDFLFAGGKEIGRFWGDKEAAKAAAQSHFNTTLSPALHPSHPPVSAPVGMVEKWPEPGDKMQFLDRNGYDVELEAARKVFTKGQVVTVKKFDLGGWCSSITFEELPGKWNSVMFARSPAVEGK